MRPSFGEGLLGGRAETTSTACGVMGGCFGHPPVVQVSAGELL